jgi:hypothetical protein
LIAQKSKHVAAATQGGRFASDASDVTPRMPSRLSFFSGGSVGIGGRRSRHGEAMSI